MSRKEREPRQLPLLSASDMGPPDDPVGVALGIADDDSARVWREAMDLYGRIATRAYFEAHAAPEPASVSAA